MKKTVLLIFAALMLSAALYGEEIYRIRVENRARGLVQVSLDRGRTYYAGGRVTRAASRTRRAFLAADYTEGGLVAAAASHGIRIKVSPSGSRREDGPDDMSIFSLVPAELFTEPELYGGIPTGDSGIHTDVAAGSFIFGNLAPFQGSRVFLEKGGALEPLKTSYVPAEGDILVITVQMPETQIKYIDFENRPGGDVTAYLKDGGSYLLTKVEQPVKGVGRFDGTAYDRPGQLNTVHGGVVTIDTSPKRPAGTRESTKDESRGGFMIQPLFHYARHDDAVEQVMVIGSRKDDFELEGRPPLFKETLGLWYYPEHPENSFRAMVKFEGEEAFKDVPAVTGLSPDCFVKKGRRLEYVRLMFGEYSPELALKEAEAAASALAEKVKKQGARPKADIFGPEIPSHMAGADYYIIYLDGVSKGAGNDTAKMLMDTSALPGGVHHLLIRASFNGKETADSSYFLK
ncbi:MAG: hypothetical protein ILO36_05890 [Abditibacteriota bacterium]|nr:hypothetical protein [Abditibacteriota bacterium]